MNVELILKIIIFGCLGAQLAYFLFVILPFLLKKDSQNYNLTRNASIQLLVACKNESHQLKSLLQSIFKQKNLDYKVLIIDDFSDEKERQEMQAISEAYHNVEIINNERSGKKRAISKGVERCEEYILFTDADCRPNSDFWAAKMRDCLDDSDVVLGYAPFYKQGGILNKLIRFECMWIAAQYFGWSQKANPYMGVGRNLAIRKSVFEKYSNKIKGNELISGDDDLLVQAISGKAKVKFTSDQDTFVYSMAESDYRKYLIQKRRHVSTSVYYKPIHQFFLALDAASKILFLPSLLLATLFLEPSLISIMLIFKILLSYIVYSPIALRLREKDILWISPIIEWIYGIHLIILAVFSLRSNTITWK